MDTSLIHADIFFFITSISVVVFTILGIIAMVFIVRILRNAASLSDTVRAEGELLAEDFSELRVAYKEEGMKIKYLLQFITKMLGAKSPTPRKARHIHPDDHTKK